MKVSYEILTIIGILLGGGGIFGWYKWFTERKKRSVEDISLLMEKLGDFSRELSQAYDDQLSHKKSIVDLNMEVLKLKRQVKTLNVIVEKNRDEIADYKDLINELQRKISKIEGNE